MKTKLLYSPLILPALLVLFAACGAKKNLVKTTTSTTVATKTTTGNAPNPELQKLGFLQKVADNAVYANNIVGDMKFNLKVDGRDITAPGSLHSFIRIRSGPFGVYSRLCACHRPLS